MPHHHGSAHVHTTPEHGHAAGVSSGTMGVAVLLTVAFVVLEAAAGRFGHSLALLSDAGHNLADAAALGLSWYALSVASKPSHHGMTFGYHRLGIFAALINAVSLVVIALLIASQAIVRLRYPQPANGFLMIGVAAVAMIINAVIALWLHRGSADDLNVRAAYLHVAGDAASALGVVVAGVIVASARAPRADPIMSLLIAGLILYSSYDVLRESASVLAEGTPKGIDMPEVISAIRNVAGVLDVHDLHVWTVGPGVLACSCHVVVAEQSVREGQQVLRAIVHDIDRRFQITHTTVQVEVEGCEANDMYCIARRALRN